MHNIYIAHYAIHNLLNINFISKTYLIIIVFRITIDTIIFSKNGIWIFMPSVAGRQSFQYSI